jgi:hypothetical protein
MALAVAGDVRPPEESEEESSEEEEEAELLPGPVDAEQCTLGGPGYTGGSAKSTVSFFVTAKDERGTRIREGGAYVTATISPGNAARAGGADVVHAEVKDGGDGTYVVTYSVAARGDYEVNGPSRGRSLLAVLHACLLLPA